MSGPVWRCGYYSLAECGLRTQSDLPDVVSMWLTAEERRELARFRSPDRARSWVAGRVAAKRLLGEFRFASPMVPTALTIVSRDHAGRGVAPVLFVSGEAQSCSLSISHSNRGVLVGVSFSPGARLGVDLVLPGPERAGFRRLWFSECEEHQMRLADGHLSSMVLWAAKEAAYKASGDGRPFVPREFEIAPDESGWLTCRVSGRDLARTCRIHWWRVDGQIAVLAVHYEHTAGDRCTMRQATGSAGQPLAAASTHRRQSHSISHHHVTT